MMDYKMPQRDADDIQELEMDVLHPRQLIHGEVTKAIIGATFQVHNHPGYGFLERVYQRALQVKLVKRGYCAEIEQKIRVQYKGIIAGEYAADLVADEKVIVEIKVAPQYSRTDEPQLINELKATGFEVGMLVNFGRTRAAYKRIVCQSAFHPGIFAA